MLLVELDRVPSVLAPVEPVLHQYINRNFSLPKLCSSVEDFLLTVVPLPALPVSVGPLRKQWRRTRETPVIRDDAVQFRPIKEVVVDGLPHLRTKCRCRLWGPHS